MFARHTLTHSFVLLPFCVARSVGWLTTYVLYSLPLAPLAVRGAYASAARALQAEGGSGAPEAGEGAGGAPLGGGSEDGAGALLPLAAGVVRETGGERSVGLA